MSRPMLWKAGWSIAAVWLRRSIISRGRRLFPEPDINILFTISTSPFLSKTCSGSPDRRDRPCRLCKMATSPRQITVENHSGSTQSYLFFSEALEPSSSAGKALSSPWVMSPYVASTNDDHAHPDDHVGDSVTNGTATKSALSGETVTWSSAANMEMFRAEKLRRQILDTSPKCVASPELILRLPRRHSLLRTRQASRHAPCRFGCRGG